MEEKYVCQYLDVSFALVLRDFPFIEHYFFDKIPFLTKVSSKIWFKRLESAYNNILL